MTIDKLHPNDLKEGLSTMPLLHLIPKQDLAPLVSFSSIDAVPSNLGDDDITKSSAGQMRDEMNKNPEYFSKVIDYLANDFRDFEDNELDDISFKRPHFRSDALNNELSVPEMPPFEKRLFEDIKEVDDSSIKENIIPQNIYQCDSLLLFQPHNDTSDVTSMIEHNNKYTQMFENEIAKTNLCTKDDSRSSTELSKTNTPEQMKRLLDSSDLALSSENKRNHKTTFLNQDQLRNRAYDELVTLINNVGLVDEENDNSKFMTNDNDHKLLTSHSLIIILDNLSRILHDPIFDNMDLEYLLRVEKLCIRSVHEALHASWGVLIEMADMNNLQDFIDNYPSIQKLFERALNSTTASKIILEIFDSRRNEKKLLLDESFKSIVDLAYLLVQDVILPFANRKVLDIQIANNLKTFYVSLITDICTMINMISCHIEKSTVDEYLLTRLEYLSIMIIFADTNTKERTSYIGVSNFETLRVSSCKILSSIFEHHLDQRQFILNEVLTNFYKLPTQKTMARQFKLNRGGNIQLVTVLLLSLLQSFDISNCSQEANSIIQELNEENSNLLTENRIQSMMDNVSSLHDEITKTSNDIATFLVDGLHKNPDNQQRQLLELLLEDLLTVVVFPEWPSAEILLVSIFRALLYTVLSGTYSAQIETTALDLTGIIGVRIFELKRNNVEIHQLSMDSTSDDVRFFAACFVNSLEYVQLQAIKNTRFVSAFRILMLKFIFQIKPLLQYTKNEKNSTRDQLAALNSDNDSANQSQVQSEVNIIYSKLLNMLADDGIKLNQALSSNKDSVSVSSYIHILLSKELITLFDTFLNVMVNTLDSTKVKSKTKAIRTLSSLIDIDPGLLISPKIQESISRRLLDSSPLVRDAVIDLISRFMQSKPEVIDQFHKPICDRLNDESIQVRKRVIKLSKSMYSKTEKLTIRSQIALKILRRLDDEDDVMADIAKSYLLELWFTSLVEEVKDKEVTNIAIAASKRTEVIMEIISAGGRTATYFEMFLTDYVLSHPDPRVMQSVKLMIDKTLDLIIDINDSEVQLHAEKPLMLIATFVRCDGKLMTQDQLVSLQPFLVDEKNSGEAICIYSLQILKHVLPCLSALRPEFIDIAQSYLLRRLTKFNVKELHEAMPCVWRLCLINNDTVKLANASISCMKLIKPYIDLFKKDEKVDMNTKLQRLLHLLGCFGTYCKLEKHRNIYLKSRVGLKENETVISVITKFLLFFSATNFLANVRKISVKNIISICSTHPKLFMSDAILKVLDREFEDADVEIKRTIIQGIMDFLRAEDNNSKKINGVQTKSSTDIKLDVAVFHGDAKTYVNDGICAAIIQRYLTQILIFCLQESDDLAILPVQFVQLVVKLGFANPKICIPYIIALESTTNPHIRHIAYELHKELFEKHESLSDSSYLEGLRLAVKFRKRTSDNIYQENFFIKHLYSIVNGNYSSRKKFILSLSKIFGIDLGYSKLEDNTFQRDTVIYAAFNISAIHFVSLEEAFILIHSIDKVISREGLDLSEKILKETKSNIPNNESIAYKRNLCVNAQTLTAMIIFRNHLGATYNISSIQLENYKPNRADLELRQPPKLVSVMPLPIETEGLNFVLKNSESFNTVYTRFFQAIHEFIE